MVNQVVIKNARVVNEGTTIETDLKIVGERIDRVESEIRVDNNSTVVDALGKYLLPGMIDDQVHFREPGLTHKGSIATESRAAVAGGITSYMEMPNVKPSTTTIDALENKYAIAKTHSLANYAFYLGATEDNLEQIKALDLNNHCGVKVFMGASTGDLLVEHPEALESIFRESDSLIVTHCESSPIIQANVEALKKRGDKATIFDHPKLRSAEACYASSSYAVGLAKKYATNLHVLHITTEKELSLFERGPIEQKHITAEACVHHLWFSEENYAELGNLIKCNPSIKTSSDRDALLQAVNGNIIDIIATDHAPHTLDEKRVDYSAAPAGLPLVQHALLSLLDHVNRGTFSMETVVEKVCHNPAKRYSVVNRGFIREGYYADLVLVDVNKTTHSTHANSLYHCGWTPFNGHNFSSNISSTWVNGARVFDGREVRDEHSFAHRLVFNRR